MLSFRAGGIRPTIVAALVSAGTILALLPVGPQAAATPPGPNGDLVFAATHGAPVHGIYIVNPADSHPALDTVEEGNYSDAKQGGIGPVFSSGGLLAMSLDQNDNGKPRIAIGTRTYKTDQTDLKTITTTHLGDFDPAWRPNSSLVAFTGVMADTGGVSRIAYDHFGDIWTMATDGSDKRQLTTTGGSGSPNQDPSWKPDGTAIAFDTFANGGQHLAVIDSDGSDFRLLAPTVDGSAPVWSPDGRTIAFDSFEGDSSKIDILNVATGAVTALTTPVTGRLDLYPSWSPNGNKIVYERFDEQSNSGTLFTISATGGSSTQLTAGHHPSWSPDGDTVVYTKPSSGDSNFDIYSIGVGGGSPTRLTNNAADDYEPTWSHNGNKILFSSARDSDGDVFVMDADGSNETKLTGNSGHYTNNGQHAPDGQAVWGPPVASTKTYIFTAKPDGTDVQKVTNPITGGNPAWSPDGSRIAFSDKGRIWTIGPTGLGLAAVTTGATPTTNDADPSYSPNGSRIAFSGAAANGDRAIYTIGTDGRGLAKVVGAAGDKDRSPVWSPSGPRLAFVNHDVFTVNSDGTGLTQLTTLGPADAAQSVDWGSTGPPDTIINNGPSGTIGARDVTFTYSSSRAPSTFECKLEGAAGLADTHDWSACGSGSTGSKSYTDLDAGSYTFRVRAKNSTGTDATPATSSFNTAPPGVTVVIDGSGGGRVTSSPTGISCSPSKQDCTHVFKGSVTLTAKPDGLSRFTGWSGDCTGRSTCTVKAQNNSKTVYATFDLSGDGPPECSNGPSSTKTVGDWELEGCWHNGPGSSVTSDELVLLNGIGLYPDDSTITLKPNTGALSSDGRVTVLAGPDKSGGSQIGPIYLHQGRLDLDLRGGAANAALARRPGESGGNGFTLTAPANANFLGLNMNGDTITFRAPSPGTVAVSGKVRLPDLVGGDLAPFSFTVTSHGGIRLSSLTIGPLDLTIAGMYHLNDGKFVYVGSQGWQVSGSVVVPGGSGGFKGTFIYSGGTLTSATVQLTHVAIGGLVADANVTFRWTSNRWSMNADVDGATLSGTVTFQHGALQSLLLKGANINVFGLVGITSFSFGYDADKGWFANGTVTGGVAGSFSAVFAYTNGQLKTAKVNVSSLQVGDLFILDKLNVTYSNTGNNDTWHGDATLSKDDGPLVTADFKLAGGQLVFAQVSVPHLNLFNVIDISNFKLGLNTPGANYCGAIHTHWGVQGAVDVAGVVGVTLNGGLGFSTAGNMVCGHADVSKAYLAGLIEVNDLAVEFNGHGDWGGNVDVVFPFATRVEANITMVHGNLANISGGIHVPALGLPLGASGIFLHGGEIGLQVMPQYAITGGIDLSAGPKIPYLNVAAIGLSGTMQLRFPGGGLPGGLSAHGDATLVGLPLAEANFDYNFPAQIHADGCLGTCKDGMVLLNGLATITAKVEGDINGLSGFQVSGQAGIDLHWKGCVPFTTHCWDSEVGIDGKAIVSNKGLAGCGHIKGLSSDWSAGVGYKWGKSPEIFDGCDLSTYRSVTPAASPALRPAAFGVADFRVAPAIDPVTVPAGATVESFKFTGTKAAPFVTLHGPNGEVIDATADKVGVQDGHLIEMDPKRKTTVVLIDHPSAGVWTATLDSDSPSPIGSSSQASGLADPSVTATVTGTGLQRTLSWTLHPLPGQSVQFVETGADSSKVIAVTSAATGSVAFRPAPGSSGTRTITAQVIQDGLPRQNTDVTTYDAPASSVLAVTKLGAGSGTVKATGAPIDCGKVCGATITPGKKVTLTATPAKGMRFLGWQGACGSTARTCTIIPAVSTAVSAVFDKVRAPKISSMSPHKGKRGSMVTLSGSGFLGATKVRFGKVRAGSMIVASDTELRVVVPGKAKTARIKVTGPGGTGHSKKKFHVT